MSKKMGGVDIYICIYCNVFVFIINIFLHVFVVDLFGFWEENAVPLPSLTRHFAHLQSVKFVGFPTESANWESFGEILGHKKYSLRL